MKRQASCCVCGHGWKTSQNPARCPKCRSRRVVWGGGVDAPQVGLGRGPADGVNSEGRPVVLDLFCKAGGCTKGYQRAGFYVVGVDIEPQPNYCGDEFHQGDALEVLRDLGRFKRWMTLDGTGLAGVHASPPCQAFTKYKNTGAVGDYPDLIDPVRDLLEALEVPYVIENVEGSPLRNPVTLCGSGFDMDIRRHRFFQTTFALMSPGCAHGRQAPNRFPGGRSKERTGSNRGLCRATVEVGTWDIPLEVQCEAMGIDWMTLEELSEAIPPAYTEHIGGYLMQAVERERVAA